MGVDIRGCSWIYRAKARRTRSQRVELRPINQQRNASGSTKCQRTFLAQLTQESEGHGVIRTMRGHLGVGGRVSVTTVSCVGGLFMCTFVMVHRMLDGYFTYLLFRRTRRVTQVERVRVVHRFASDTIKR